MKVASLAEGNHSFSIRPYRFSFRQSGLDSIELDQAANLVRQQQIPMFGFAAQFNRLFCVAHNFFYRETSFPSSLRSPPIGGSTNPDSNFIPRLKPSCCSFSLISFNDFFPKLRYFSISASVFIAN